jgi:hypothetical protein
MLVLLFLLVGPLLLFPFGSVGGWTEPRGEEAATAPFVLELDEVSDGRDRGYFGFAIGDGGDMETC